MDIPDNAACSEEMLFFLLHFKYKQGTYSFLNCILRFHVAMLQCWIEDPQERPTFSELVVGLSSKLTEMANYLDLNEMDVPAAAKDTESVGNTMQ